MKGGITSLLFLALEEVDLPKLSATKMDRIIQLLKQESAEVLEYNLQLTPTKVSDFIVKILNEM
jgi:hypothetical protein